MDHLDDVYTDIIKIYTAKFINIVILVKCHNILTDIGILQPDILKNSFRNIIVTNNIYYSSSPFCLLFSEDIEEGNTVPSTSTSSTTVDTTSTKGRWHPNLNIKPYIILNPLLYEIKYYLNQGQTIFNLFNPFFSTIIIGIEAESTTSLPNGHTTTTQGTHYS